jgi:RimJ/RimL family protein N-acetyltransferase
VKSAASVVKQANLEQEDTAEVVRKRHEQMLKLVSKSFYNELVNYGVNDAEVLSVAGNLLDNVMHNPGAGGKGAPAPTRLFGSDEIRDEWAAAKRLSVDEVSIVPLAKDLAGSIANWLRAPAIRENFHPPFPGSEKGLARYFQSAMREYFAILYREDPVGLVGAEHIDRRSGKVEMRKLVGDPRMHGKGIGKRATFLFLYYLFVIRKFEKVYVHSMDTNIRNVNLNAKFGFGRTW